MKTYNEIYSEMENYITSQKYHQETTRLVFMWMTEYSERNHNRMVDIAKMLKKIEKDYYDEDFDINQDDKEKIFNIGCEIHKEGGLGAQQACFYIATNFIDCNDKRLKAIELCWDGAGDWQM